MRGIAWRAFWRRKKESGLTVALLALVLLLAMWFAYTLVGYAGGLSLSEARLGADVVLFAKEAPVDGSAVLFSPQPINAYFEAAPVEAALRSMPGVAAWTPQFFAQTLNADCCSVEGENRLVGIDWASDFLVKPWVRGVPPERFDGNVAILGGGVPSYEDEIEILGAPFHVVARLRPTGTAMDQTIFVPLDVARALVAASDTVVELWGRHDPAKSLSAIFIRAEARYNPDLLAYQLSRLPEVTVIRTSDVITGARETLSWMGRLLGVFGGFAFGFGALAVFGRVAADVRRRQNDFALIVALGAPRRRVYAWLFWETMYTAFGAALLAAVAVALAWPFLRDAFLGGQGQPFVAPPPAAVVLGAAVLVAFAWAVQLLVALWAVGDAVRRPVGEVLKEEGGL
ncbi:MAG: hypothetical protein KM312_05220 [Hydrogenibacillus schlegelii]|uniref:ABC3 transporter permease C-terminal domain-containing protein n=1 Tax=Hydrogenibacillus schlegelii TaxID=1484 RepID=A0A947CX54_HYDSH|nr:hypothetical protein [Hydrogenibacillus schlegelii]